MSEIGTEQAAPLAKPMPACMSFYAIRGEGMSTYMYMQYGVHVGSTESLTSQQCASPGQGRNGCYLYLGSLLHSRGPYK